MQSTLIKIGNSKGVRIPASLLKEYDFTDEVFLELQEDGILLKPAKKPRKGWSSAFKNMHTRKEDTLLMPDVFKDEKFGNWK